MMIGYWRRGKGGVDGFFRTPWPPEAGGRPEPGPVQSGWLFQTRHAPVGNFLSHSHRMAAGYLAALNIRSERDRGSRTRAGKRAGFPLGTSVTRDRPRQGSA